MREWVLSQLRHPFSDGEKEPCVPTIEKLIALSRVARQKGTLALEAEMAEESGFFLKTGIGMVTDGCDPKYIEAVLQSLIAADDYTGAELLNRLLMLEGILAIQRGESPSQIAMRLGAMLGEKYLPRVLELGRENSAPGYFEMMRVISGKKAEPISEPFEERLLPLPNRTLQIILRNTNLADWEKALRGCGAEMIQRVLDNVSQTMALRFCEAITDTKDILSAAIILAQKQILEAVERLEHTGEIII